MRWTRRTVAGLICGAFALAGLVSESRGGELDESEFRRLQRELRPKPDEAWRTIPWRINLLEAQRTAAQEGKPIFIWAMDGHPLGCT
jgi:hypothetical protein